jgi:transcriptional regulator with XRE-family HTH domain
MNRRNYVLFNERLRALREDNDLTQEKLSKVLHLSGRAISGYENCKREPCYDTLMKIASYFNVSTDYLFGRTDISTPYPKK